MFQFLIGTVKTLDTQLLPGLKMKFQFLIGTVKTRWRMVCIITTSQFQFLIGTVKTNMLQWIILRKIGFNSS